MAEQKDSPRIKSLKYKSRINSIKAGIFASAKSSFGDYFISPFAIAINASNSLIALFTSVSGILGPLSQIFGSRLIEKSSRKKIVLNSVFAEFLSWIPIVAVAILYWSGTITNVLPILLLLFFSFYIIVSNVGNPAWFSWTGDIINERYRGRWFSKRNLLMGVVSVVFAIVASFFLDYMNKLNFIMLGFVILFGLAILCRIISWEFYRKQYEPKLELEDGYYFSFFNFLTKARKTNFGRFSFFNALFSLSISIASPFFVIYMLRDLKFNYLTYMIITLAGTVFSLFVMEWWGKISDKYGNYLVMYITAILTPITAILWIVSPSPIYLIFVPVLISGVAASGFNIASNDFIYDNVRVEKRGLAVSYFNMLNGIGIFIGAAIGAFLIQFLTIQFIKPILAIFLLSGIVGLIVVFLSLPMIEEVKTVKRKGISNVIFKQFRPVIMGEFHEIKSLKRYFRK